MHMLIQGFTRQGPVSRASTCLSCSASSLSLSASCRSLSASWVLLRSSAACMRFLSLMNSSLRIPAGMLCEWACLTLTTPCKEASWQLRHIWTDLALAGSVLPCDILPMSWALEGAREQCVLLIFKHQ